MGVQRFPEMCIQTEQRNDITELGMPHIVNPTKTTAGSTADSPGLRNHMKFSSSVPVPLNTSGTLGTPFNLSLPPSAEWKESKCLPPRIIVKIQWDEA